jgi:hypothetical protein
VLWPADRTSPETRSTTHCNGRLQVAPIGIVDRMIALEPAFHIGMSGAPPRGPNILGVRCIEGKFNIKAGSTGRRVRMFSPAPIVFRYDG